MAPVSNEVKKNGRKKGSLQKEAEPEKEGLNSEVEMQIQSEMERSQRGDVTQEVAGALEERGIEEEDGEMKDSVDQGVETINENLAFSFKIPCPSSTIREGRTRVSITPTKISGDPKFLKRTINDLSFTL